MDRPALMAHPISPIAPLTHGDVRSRRGHGKRFSNSELALALRLLGEREADGTRSKSDAQIALAVGCKAETIRQIRHRYADTTAEAAAILKATAAGAATDWVKARRIAAAEGRHEPAKQQLEAVGAVQTPRQPGAGTTVVIVGVGTATQTVGPDPWKGVLDVTPSALPEKTT